MSINRYEPQTPSQLFWSDVFDEIYDVLFKQSEYDRLAFMYFFGVGVSKLTLKKAGVVLNVSGTRVRQRKERVVQRIRSRVERRFGVYIEYGKNGIFFELNSRRLFCEKARKLINDDKPKVAAA